MSVDEILNSLTHLKQPQVHAALTCCFGHRAAIDQETLKVIRRATLEATAKKRITRD